jgi:hypothetical protein
VPPDAMDRSYEGFLELPVPVVLAVLWVVGAALEVAGVYLAALFFRTIDNEVCPVLPIGTHFVWHLLIGLVTYLAMRSLILRTTTAVRARVR